MLVVRSQDREKLIVNNVAYYIYNDENYNICASNLNDLESDVTLAKYSTEEKALKVLDMLEEFFTADKNGTFNFPKDYEEK